MRAYAHGYKNGFNLIKGLKPFVVAVSARAHRANDSGNDNDKLNDEEGEEGNERRRGKPMGFP